MLYTVGDMAKRLGVAPSTLRYYDKMGLLPFVERSHNGIRCFKETDIEWLRVIECLKKTGMCLADIKCFVEMSMRGDDTIDERLALIVKQRESVKAQLEDLNKTLKVLEYKEWYYNTAKKSGTTSVLRNMTLEEVPEEHREARMALRGE